MLKVLVTAMVWKFPSTINQVLLSKYFFREIKFFIISFTSNWNIFIYLFTVCSAPTIQSKDSGIDLICTVDSKPLASTYRWLFNSSETTFEIPSAESTMFFSNYKSSTDEGHGQVLCWASNNIGEQKSPCVFHVVPLGSPSPPKECKVWK